MEYSRGAAASKHKPALPGSLQSRFESHTHEKKTSKNKTKKPLQPRVINAWRDEGGSTRVVPNFSCGSRGFLTPNFNNIKINHPCSPCQPHTLRELPSTALHPQTLFAWGGICVNGAQGVPFVGKNPWAPFTQILSLSPSLSLCSALQLFLRKQIQGFRRKQTFSFHPLEDVLWR